jgi:hypothetical protein
MGHRRQQRGRFIARGVHQVTRETGARRLQEGRPRGLSAAWGRLRHQHGVALGGHGHQAQPAGTRGLLGDGEVWGGPVVCPTRAGLSAGRPAGLLALTGDLGLRPRGCRAKAIKAGALPQQTPQAPAPGTHCRPPQGYPAPQTRPAGQPRGTVAKGHDGGMVVKTGLRRPPCLQRAAGHIERLGGVTQGEPRGVQRALRRTPRSPCTASPALVASRVAVLLLLADRSHRARLVPSFPLVDMMAKDGEGACWFQPFVMASL